MINRIKIAGLFGIATALLSSVALAEINRVRVVNDSSSTIYIHVGGFAPSAQIKPGRWKIFYYPFNTTPPGKSQKVNSSLLVATAGGRWITTPNGFTYLNKPQMVICLNYKNYEHRQKTGNRVWTIKSARGFDKNCQVKGYKQPWHKPSTSLRNLDIAFHNRFL